MKRIARKCVFVPIFIILSFIIVGCNASPAATPIPSPTTQAVVSATELPTLTKTATSTLLSTSVPTPSLTKASATPLPTDTPSPTLTSTATPSPTVNPTETPIPTDTALPTIAQTAVSPPSSTNPTTLSLADLPTHSGEEVTVSGQVVAAASFSQGFKFTLDDGSGRADLLLWHNVYDNTWDAPQLNMGAVVQATGEVGQYEGTWQLVPNFGGDVKVTTPGNGSAPPRTIGELTNHVGEVAQISGTILRLEGAGSGVKIFVGDETGEIVVFVWRTILDRIPNNVALGEAGTRVRVNGRVENFRSNLEVVPAIPYDVEVLP